MANHNMNNRWQCGKSLAESMTYLLENSLLMDITFVIGPSQSRISAHKLVLAARSPVFNAMLVGPLAGNHDIFIADIEEDIFVAMLRYMYSDDIEISSSNVMDLIVAADFYDIEGLKIECDKFLVESNAHCRPMQSFELSTKYRLKELCKRSLKMISINAPKYLSEDSEEFKVLEKSNVQKILESDDLLLSEIEVYQAAVRWAEAECKRQDRIICDENIRKVLDSVIHAIRFPVMSAVEFCDKVAIHSILSPEDKNTLFRSFLTEKEKQLGDFKIDKRLTYRDTQLKRSRCMSTESSSSYTSGRVDAISFEVDAYMMLRGIEMCGFKDANQVDEYKVSLYCRSSDTPIISATGKATIADIKNDIYEVLFCDIIEIDPCVRYSIEVELKSTDISHLIVCDGSDTLKSVGCSIKLFNVVKPNNENETTTRFGHVCGFLLRIKK